ncbi:MAG: c-type cytochrome biogenesis protein CcsB [Armatimonadota bacterium]|nr:c-type cytochrome biogenesis protein CcsB [Armatimonadota bacterium]
MLSDILWIIAVTCYSAAAAAFLWSAGTFSTKATTAKAVAAAGLLVHAALMVLLGFELGRVPLTNLRESLLFVGWAVMAFFLATRSTRRPAVLGAAAALICAALVVSASVAPGSTCRFVLPVLRSRWSVVHVAASLGGYAGFALAFAAGALYCVNDSLLKNKRVGRWQTALPSLDTLDRFAYKMVALGFPLFTLGVVTGSMWAQSAWGTYWSWDPKETWSLVTWLVYAAYLHVRVFLGRRGKFANRLLLIGFACTLITFLGVSLFAGGLHSYTR